LTEAAYFCRFVAYGGTFSSNASKNTGPLVRMADG
jgi:hypothetical protein